MNSERNEILRQIDEMAKAFINSRKDSSSQYPLYHHSDKLRLFMARRQLFGWEKIKAHFDLHQKREVPGSDTKWKIFNEDVTIENKMAFASGNYQFESNDWKEVGRFTIIFKKYDETWKIVHRHMSLQFPMKSQEDFDLVDSPYKID